MREVEYSAFDARECFRDDLLGHKCVSHMQGARSRTLKMTGKNVAQRMDSMEEAMVAAQEEFQREMGSLKDEIQTMNKRFEQFIKLQEDTGGSNSYKGEKMLSPNFGGGSSSGGTRHDFRFRKLEMPLFDGSNPDGWILKAERYFSVNRLSNEEKLEAAIIAFEGDALLWYQWENRKRSIVVWEEMRVLILKQFRVTQAGSLYEQWLALTQGSSVREYRRKFIELSAPLENITDELALGNFINGLKPEIRVEVRIMEPNNLGRAMDLAQKIEEKLWVTKTHKADSGFQRAGGSTRGVNLHSEASRSSIGANHNTARLSGEIRRLSDSELQKKREKGLCYRCDEKWAPGHRCKKKELTVLLTYDMDEAEHEEAEGSGEVDPELETAEINQVVEVSLNSVVGLTTPKTMKLKGIIGEQEVVVLIDSGATHNFISLDLVSKMQIPIVKTGAYGVTMGTGAAVKGEGLCRGVTIHLHGIDIVEEFLPLGLGSSDVILGVQWLETLGMTHTNWKTQVMKFMVGNESVTLRGDLSLGKTLVSLKAMMRTIKHEGAGILVECNQFEGLCEVSPEVPTDLNQVLAEYELVFNMPMGLPPTRGHEHSILLKDGSQPVSVRPYRYPHAQKDEIERLIQEMLDAGIIQVSNSPFSSPVLLVKKKDGSWRFCVDYRALNKATVPDKYPIPVIDELLDELHGARIFSKLDLKSGYHQIRVSSQDVHKTAFRTHDGHYEFLVMPFGLTNAPATFQSLMNDVFRPYLRKFVLVFFDDILIYSPSMESHQQHLALVLGILQANSLYANRKKCEFGRTQVAYLGHIISGQGVAADPSKIQAMNSWPTPTNLKALRGFLGLTGYYRKFVAGYARIASPLTDQLKKDRFGWSSEAAAAFEELKQAMSSVPVLAMPDFTKPFIVETDASGFGLGAVLLQGQQPVAYYSQVLGPRARLKSIYEKELMAIVFAILKWRPYLLGRRFIVRTDQQSLKFLLEQRIVGVEYQKWITKIMGYDFDIQYRSGASNRVADALSRLTEPAECSALAIPQWQHWDSLKVELAEDTFLKKLREDITSGTQSHVGFSVEHGVLFYKSRLVIPQTSKLLSALIGEFHTTPIGGHSGETKTYLRLAAELYWIGMRKDVTRFVRECTTCQQNKYLATTPAGLLQPIPLPAQVWEEVTLDFIEGLPRSEGWDAILVVVDRLSKYAHFIGLKHPFSAVSVAGIFVREIVRLHGIPQSIISDRDRIFLSHFWSELFKLQGTTLKRSTAYHPQSDGQTEVVNRCLETYLRCFASGKPRSWARWLAWAEYWYNTSFHSSTRCTPFRALYGRDPPPLIRYEQGAASVSLVEQLMEDRDAILDDLRMQLLRAQQRMKLQADQKRHHVEFHAGDLVFLKLRPYRQRSLAQRKFEKLAARYYGPFKVLQRIGKVAYKLELPQTAKLHPVFHVSQLRAALGVSPFSPTIPPQLTPELELVVEPEKLLGVRPKVNGQSGEVEVLVKWKSLPEFEATWEDFHLIQQQFPDFHLEDKVKVWADGNVRPQVRFTYARRKGNSRNTHCG
ncbi:hypothetical protein KPL70_026202 [Citrus sinensis]|nr:hypothetical protein KPL70_026202 [Citrus sinensis]